MQAFNFVTMTEYSGRNALLVGNGKLPAFASFNQLKNGGFMVKKGSKSVPIFCGYRENKSGERVPCYGRVFDIVDTTAADDPAFIEWLAEEVQAGRLNKSAVKIDLELVGAMA